MAGLKNYEVKVINIGYFFSYSKFVTHGGRIYNCRARKKYHRWCPQEMPLGCSVASFIYKAQSFFRVEAIHEVYNVFLKNCYNAGNVTFYDAIIILYRLTF